MSDNAKVIVIDLQIDEWRIVEALAYRSAVGVNAEYAVVKVNDAIRASLDGARAEFGAAVDVPGWQPPDGWAPPELLNLDPHYLLGFAWIAARRDEPTLTYEAFAETLTYGELVGAFWGAMERQVEEVAVPLVNREQRRRSGRPSKTASRSATPTTGPSPTSDSSRSASTSPRSKSSAK